MRHACVSQRRERIVTFRQKHLWITLLTTLGVWGFYFWNATARVLQADLRNDRLAVTLSALFILCLVAVTVVEVVLTLIATLTTRKAEREAKDEREMLAALKASHISLMALIAMVFCGAMGAYFTGLIGGNMTTPWQSTISDVNLAVIVANILLAFVVVSETIRAGFTLALLGRGR